MRQRPCLDCGTLTTNPSRCDRHAAEHERQRYRARPTTAERGLGAAYQRHRRQVLDRDGWICHWCGAAATTADHVIPRALGGSDMLDNLVAACQRCNSSRTARVRRA